VSTSRRTRVTRSDPEQVAADLEAFRHALETEAERDLTRDPERKRFAKASDPDEHRRRVRRQAWRAEP
jgi:hypothetical protein